MMQDAHFKDQQWLGTYIGLFLILLVSTWLRNQVYMSPNMQQFEDLFTFRFKSAVSKYIVVSLEQVSVTPAHSLDYTLTPLSGDKYTSCLCGNERLTLSWNMSPTALGESSSFHPHFCQSSWITVPISTSFKSLWN